MGLYNIYIYNKKCYTGLSDTFIIIRGSALVLKNVKMKLLYQIENYTRYENVNYIVLKNKKNRVNK